MERVSCFLAGPCLVQDVTVNRTDAVSYPAAVYIPVWKADNMLANK